MLASSSKRCSTALRRLRLNLGLHGQAMLQVCHAEGHVPRLVARGQTADLPRDRVGGMLVQEVQQVHEAALAEHRQQEGRLREIPGLEERAQRGLAAGRGQRRLPPLERGAPGEDLHVAGLVGALQGQQLHHLAVVRMHLPEVTGRHQQRGVLVLDQVGHHLHHGGFHGRRQLELGGPIHRGGRVPLRGGGLGVELAGGGGQSSSRRLSAKAKGGLPASTVAPRAARPQLPGASAAGPTPTPKRAWPVACAPCQPAFGLGAPCDPRHQSAIMLFVQTQRMALAAAPGRQVRGPGGRSPRDAQLGAGRTFGQRAPHQQQRAFIEAQGLNIDSRRGGCVRHGCRRLRRPPHGTAAHSRWCGPGATRAGLRVRAAAARRGRPSAWPSAAR